MIVLVGGQKGGTGKTSLATNLAVVRAQAGGDVLLVDTDDQRSAATWAATRAELEPQPGAAVATIEKRGKGLWRELASLAERYGDLVIDAGGRNTTELRQAMLVADVLYTPVQASQYDLDTLEAMAELIDEAGAAGAEFKSRVVLNRVPTHPTMREWREARDVVADFPAYEMSRAMIRERVTWRRSAEDGLAVTEVSPSDERAVDELKTLYKEAFNDA